MQTEMRTNREEPKTRTDNLALYYVNHFNQTELRNYSKSMFS
jgi:hypothetical protein